MDAILYYLLKVSIGTTAFYATYHILFRKSKQFVFNRIYLAGSFIAAFIIPLITFTTGSYVSQVTVYFSGKVESSLLPSETTGTAIEPIYGLAEILVYLYLFGLVFCLVKLIYGYMVAARIRKECTEKIIGGMNVWVSEENDLAFTFLDKIIIGKNLVNHPSLEMVLNHEAVHSREQHFYDIFLAELLSTLQWFNPFARFHAQAIRNNLEFQADDRATEESDKQEYQFTMLSIALNCIDSPLFAAINSSNLKKRIIMMNSKSKGQFAGLARLAIIPVFSLLLVSLSGKKTVLINNGDADLEQSNSQSSGLQENTPDPIKSHEGINKHLQKNLKYPAEARSAGLIGTARLYARVNPDGSIGEVLDGEPDEEFVEYDEIVIIGYTSEDTEKIKKTKSYRHEVLLIESKRVIESLPKLEIPELQGKLIQFTFKYDLR
ncbi:M56 family metallopeptidase [Pleomorphovibrio marinus]|uniref:M56 family metallopeptidase n=1 Tax=Pleomorphovibrio marinus TaxID=2164132 RepID=UPI000E0C68F4|nr:M56 family metallopeptidase [Pleomorphovibrio marinus]